MKIFTKHMNTSTDIKAQQHRIPLEIKNRKSVT